MNVETEAIIIKTQKYKEFDEIVTAFTKNLEKSICLLIRQKK